MHGPGNTLALFTFIASLSLSLQSPTNALEHSCRNPYPKESTSFWLSWYNMFQNSSLNDLFGQLDNISVEERPDELNDMLELLSSMNKFLGQLKDKYEYSLVQQIRDNWKDLLLGQLSWNDLFRNQNRTMSYKAGDVQYLYMKPNLVYEKCPSTETPCVLFSECIRDVSLCFTSNTTIHFLPGNYTTSGSMPVIVQEVANLTLVGTPSEHPSVTLHCNRNMSFVFADVANLSISGIRISNCGMEMPEMFSAPHYTREIINGTKAALFLINVDTLQLVNVYIEKSCGYGLLGFNIVGTSTITSCRFSYNNQRKAYQNEAESSDTMADSCTTKGGNALLVFQCPYPATNGMYHITLSISSSEFSHGRDTSNWYLNYDQTFTARITELSNSNEVGGGSGLGIIIHEIGLCYVPGNLSISIVNCNFHHNTAQVGANTLVRFHRDSDLYGWLSAQIITHYTIHIFNCTFQQGEAYIRGGGMSVETYDLSVYHTRVPAVNISHSNFFNNSADYGGGLYFLSRTGVSCYPSVDVPHFYLESCGLHDNTGVEGGGLHMLLQKCIDRGPLSNGITNIMVEIFGQPHPDCYSNVGTFRVVIVNSTFLKNIATRKGGGMHIHLHTMSDLFITIPSHFAVPTGKSIVINVTTCYFKENHAKYGCAISIDGCSTQGNTATARKRQTVFLFTSTPKKRCTVARDTTIMFTNAVFSKNVVQNKLPIHYGTAALQLHNIEEVSLSQCIFVDNNSSGLYTDSSRVYLKGMITFINNTGYSGGGLILDCYPYTQQSVIHVTSNTTLYLANNTAQHSGGAIAAQEGCSDSNSCFLQLNFPTAPSCPHCSSTEESIDYYNTRIIMDGNTVKFDGDSIYVWRQTAPKEICKVDSTQSLTPSIFQSLFEIPGNSSSEVVTPAYKVCFCFNPSMVYGTEDYECETSASVEAYVARCFMYQQWG